MDKQYKCNNRSLLRIFPYFVFYAYFTISWFFVSEILQIFHIIYFEILHDKFDIIHLFYLLKYLLVQRFPGGNFFVKLLLDKTQLC